jgi:hypothetical protein
MKKILGFPLGISLGVALAGCGGGDDDKQAQVTLTKFEHVFQVCKDETIKQKLQPGGHVCAKVSSIALDKTLSDAGLSGAKIDEVRAAWLEQKGFKDYYIPADKR